MKKASGIMGLLLAGVLFGVYLFLYALPDSGNVPQNKTLSHSILLRV